MYKNVTGQKLAVFAWDAGAGAAKTGDASHITGQISKDGGASAALGTPDPTELDATNHPGIYLFTLTQAETNADLVVITAKSTTANIEIRPVLAYPTLLNATNAAYLDAAVSTRAPEAGGNLAAVKAKTDNLPADPASLTAVNAIPDSVWSQATRTLTSFGTLVADIWGYGSRSLTSFGTLMADIWTNATRSLTDKAGFTISGAKQTLDALHDLAPSDILSDSTAFAGAHIAAIKAKTDALPASPANETTVAAVQAKTDNLPADPASNTQVNTRLAVAGYTAPDNAGIAAIKAKTDNLPASPANEANVETHVANALNAYDPPTKAELDAAVLPLAKDATVAQDATVAKEANVQGHAADALAAYDPPTRAEATADKDALLTAIAGLDALLDSIKAKTDGLPADPASQAAIGNAIAALNDLSVGELLAGDLADDQSFPANSLADLVRKIFWVLANRLVINDATGAFTAYKSDGATPALTGTIVDNGTTTQRSAPQWP